MPARNPRSRVEGARGGGRQWSSSDRIRRTFLDAATEVFGERGFDQASVAEIVERAGSSVGSLYHHFGGKTEVFLALWDDYIASQQRHTAEAINKARAGGEIDPFSLFLIGARIYLEDSWSYRGLTRLFYEGDTPPGFQHIRRRSSNEWIRKNFRVLRAEDEPVNRVIIFLLTSFMGEARREIISARDEEEASRLIPAMLAVVERMRPIISEEFPRPT